MQTNTPTKNGLLHPLEMSEPRIYIRQIMFEICTCQRNAR